MRFSRNKDRAPAPPVEHTIPGEPRRHARDRQPRHPATAAVLAQAVTLTDETRDYLVHTVEHLETGAGRNEAESLRLREQAADLDVNAAAQRSIARELRLWLDLDEARRLQAEQARLERETQEPAYDEARPYGVTLLDEPDLSRFNPTWQAAPRRQSVDCGCRWGDGESCDRCAMFAVSPLGPRTSLYGSNDGLTTPMPEVPSLVNGETL